jgi:hypothetical protein
MKSNDALGKELGTRDNGAWPHSRAPSVYKRPFVADQVNAWRSKVLVLSEFCEQRSLDALPKTLASYVFGKKVKASHTGFMKKIPQQSNRESILLLLVPKLCYYDWKNIFW